jgi:hypothetical protein
MVINLFEDLYPFISIDKVIGSSSFLTKFVARRELLLN